MKKLGLAITLVLLLGVLGACTDDTMYNGEHVVTNKETWIAKDLKSYGELQDCKDNNNKAGVLSLMADGNVDLVPAGMGFTVIDAYQSVDANLATVRSDDTGGTVVIGMEFLTKK